MLDSALEYAQRGWAVLPLHWAENGMCSCGDANCGSKGKHPLVSGGSKDATTDLDQVRAWWELHPQANIGIATGSASDLIVIDVDEGPQKSGYDSLASLEAKNSRIPRDLSVTTGSGGLHIYLTAPKDKKVRNSAGTLAPHIDVRGEGGYVVAPPSVHISGNLYTWNQNATH